MIFKEFNHKYRKVVTIMRRLSTIVVFAVVAIFMVAGSAIAVPLYTGSTYAPYAPIVYKVPRDLGPGYIIWSDDDSRRDWYVFATGINPPGNINATWSGEIVYDGKITSVNGKLLETGHGEFPPELTSFPDKDVLSFSDYNSGPWYDGFAFNVIGKRDNILMFNLGSTADVFNVYIGYSTTPIFTSEATNPGQLHYASFQVEAPIPNPEPTTLLLMGTGLLGVAGIGRKRIMKG